jgi:hypothetical protein
MPAQQETTLAAVVADRLFEVPDYQRPYAWERKQLADLWEDLDLMGFKGQHYFGTLVLRDIRDAKGDLQTSLDEAGSTLRHCEVVDGQQRLTTCAILLDRVRRRLQRLAAMGVDGAAAVGDNLRRTYGVVMIDNAAVPRLKLGSDLGSYWVNVILGDEVFAGGSLLGGQERLAQAVMFFDQKLEGLAAGADLPVLLQRLRELQRRVTAGLRVLVYEVATTAEVGVIFETLNERGRPLSELEKTKNYLLYLARQIPDKRQDELAEFINNRWSEIFTSLAGQDAGMEDQLLRVHWLATQDPDLRSWGRVASIKARFDRGIYVSASARLVPNTEPDPGAAASFDLLFADVKSYVMTLQHCSHFLAEMFEANASFEPFGKARDRVLNASAALGRSGVVALFRPLLCASRLKYPTDGDFYAELVELLERYSARVFVICQRRANAGQARLASLAYALYSGDQTQEEVMAGVNALLWRYAPDSRVRTFLESESENWYTRRGHKYFLYEYEMSRMRPGEEIPDFGYFTKKGNEQRTTEHVLPQKPDEDAECWWKDFSAKQHVALRHTLGNLVLTIDNSRYSNKCFDQKRGSALAPGGMPVACYAQASLHQERELATFGSWTPTSIRDRQKTLTEWALHRWSVLSPDVSVLEPEEAELEIEAEDEGDQEVAS